MRCSRGFVLLLLLITAARAEVPTIEAPLFEGGAGKAWFLRCAREYELQGDWTITLTSPSQPSITDTFTIHDDHLSFKKLAFPTATLTKADDPTRYIWRIAASFTAGAILSGNLTD